MSDRLPVKKTYKLFIGGAFPRSESGRTYEAQGQNVALASRKDVRDAVKAARGAAGGWAKDDGLQPRPGSLPRGRDDGGARRDLAELCSGREEVEAAIDRVVWYAGWSDKLAQVVGSSNPGGGAVLQLHGAGADRRRRRARAGGACAARARDAARAGARRRQRGRRRRLGVAAARAVELAEVVATSDVPGGVVNVLTGRRDELAPVLASHIDVNALDLAGADGLCAGARAARGGEREARGQGPRRRPEPVGSRCLPRAQDGLAPDRPIGQVHA